MPVKQLSGESSRRLRVAPQNRHTPDGPPALVSVVIPCFNYARFLPQALESALSQQQVSVEAIVVDDASSDNSRDIAAAFARRDPRVKLIAHAQNAGPVQTFNDGLAQARGEFLVRLDADDLLAPGALLRAVALFRAFPSVGLVYGHPLEFTGDTLPRPRLNPTAWTVWPGRHWLADRCRSGFNVITSPEAVMRMTVVRKVGGQKDLAHTHDMEMWLRLAAFSDVAYIHGADQAFHREHAASLSARKVDGYRDLVERQLAFATLFSGPAGSIPEAAALRQVAARAVAGSALQLAARCLEQGEAGSACAQRFIDFASSIVPDVTAVRGWHGLRHRIGKPRRHLRLHPIVQFQRLQRRLAATLSWRRWHRNGVF